ncbi:transposase [Nocardia sp. NEAU-G5]|uniref:Transposase n=2 Tax=Nocardia albiluteola TaxID=2842303 RepID=A0ABS6BC35_9NOCA|nr:transposase [Nocardia albiluteola]
MFTDLFIDVGRRSVPRSIVAVVMVLQRIEGLSDREAVERFAFDARWKYAAGCLDFDYLGFVHTVLVDMRARLARSQRPNRIFDAVLEVARQAGLVGRKRVLDFFGACRPTQTQPGPPTRHRSGPGTHRRIQEWRDGVPTGCPVRYRAADGE